MIYARIIVSLSIEYPQHLRRTMEVITEIDPLLQCAGENGGRRSDQASGCDGVNEHVYRDEDTLEWWF